ncbi:hypothetical protein [Nocardia suismassiliense]|uniref:hypothetical protein n=1 Tax=Nocardia suismassiliense TaxID=2077092 RepID=UPI00131F3989|nr:hypothetical protein [Nocardia suismassiliense]
MERHISVEFGIEGLPIQHYRAEESAAEAFADGVRRQGLASRIEIDDRVTPALKELPYQRLFWSMGRWQRDEV